MAVNQECKPLENNRSHLRASFSSLPTEIIAEVFCSACAFIPDDEWWKYKYTNPLWLGSICHSWREIAWQTSELWATVVIRAYDSQNLGNYEKQTDMLKQWLQRTKERKLDIFFCDSCRNPCPSPIQIMDLLVGHSGKWNTTNLYLWPKQWLSIFNPKIARALGQPRYNDQVSCRLSLPNLQTASFYQDVDCYWDYSAEELISFPNFTDAPRLRSIEFSGQMHIETKTDEHGSHLPGMIPCNITHIKLLDVTFESFLDMNDFWRTLACLQEVTIQCLDVKPLSNTMVHNCLSSLIIYDAFGDYIPDDLFPNLLLPALTKLEVISNRQPLAEISLPLIPFITNSACVLTVLVLKTLSIAEELLIDILRGVPSLQELCIHNIRKDYWAESPPGKIGSAFSVLLYPKEPAGFLPNLTKFDYAGDLHIHAVTFIEPFILRSGFHDDVQDVSRIGQTARFKQAKIMTDSTKIDEVHSGTPGQPELALISEVLRMVEAGVILLLVRNAVPSP